MNQLFYYWPLNWYYFFDFYLFHTTLLRQQLHTDRVTERYYC